MKRALSILATVLVLGIYGAAVASSIKSWSSGEVLSSTDLNSNFSHIHNTMVGGHGARLVNADVSASAAISHSKLATPSFVPKAWVNVGSICSSSPCTVASGSGITTITRASTGYYVVTFDSTRANANYALFVTPWNNNTQTFATMPVCVPFDHATTGFNLYCARNDGTAAVDTGFNIMLMDNDN